MEQRIYDCPIEVKTTVIGIEKLHSKAVIERDYGGQIGLEEMAKIKAEAILLNELRKFIQTDIEEGYREKYAHSKISLPYIYDEILKQRDAYIKRIEYDNRGKDLMIEGFELKIEYLQLPWYKKVWQAMKS